MQLLSSAFTENSPIPDKYSYHDGNVSPPLSISDVPENTKSLVLICHDPDAPKKDGFTHWVVWNIPPNTTELYENDIPSKAMLGTTDWGENDWGGPAPPSGTHRYIFYLYALNVSLDLPMYTSRQGLLQATKPHEIETTSLTGLYTAK